MSYSNNGIYHNYKVLSPDGIEMFRCNLSKFNWYIQKGLAELEPNSTNIIRLKFKPNGLGWAGDHYYLQDRENKCCVCGEVSKLTKHHVVPYCYRKEFPAEIKESNYYDVLPVCISCHTNYEKKASKKKEELATRYNAPVQGKNNTYENKSKRYILTITKFGHLIPEERKKEILKRISKDLKLKSISEEEVKNIKILPKGSQPENYISHSKMVVSKIESFQSFVEEWREHFVETMNPKYLPKYWNTKRDLHGRKRNRKED